MTKAEQLARLALARAPRLGRAAVILVTNNQMQTVELLRSIEPRAVLSLIGADAVRVHGSIWGAPRKKDHGPEEDRRAHA